MLAGMNSGSSHPIAGRFHGSRVALAMRRWNSASVRRPHAFEQRFDLGLAGVVIAGRMWVWFVR